MKQSTKLSLLFAAQFLFVHPLLASPPTAMPTTMDAPLPPSPADQKRIAFAEQAITLLKNKLPEELKSLDTTVRVPLSNKSLECLKNASCYGKDISFSNQLIDLRQQYGELTEAVNGHVVPWAFERFENNRKNKPQNPSAIPPLPGRIRNTLSSDEFTIHFTAKFKKTGEKPFYLQVILTEDSKGQIFLRGFDVQPGDIQRDQMPIPPC